MYVTLTGVFYYELENSLNDFNVQKHESYDEAVKYIYDQARTYLKKCKDGKIHDINAQMNELEKLISENDSSKYVENLGYQNDYSEFHHKIIVL